MRTFAAIALQIMLGLPLASCGIVEEMRVPDNGEPTTTAKPGPASQGAAALKSDPIPAADASAPSDGQATDDEEAQSVPDPEQVAKRKPLPEAFDPEIYLGLNQEAVRQQLGSATSENEKGQATVWIFADAHCNFALSFYLDLNSDQQRSLSYDLALASENEEAINYCLFERRSKAPYVGS